MQTTIKEMHLNGLRNLDEVPTIRDRNALQSPVNKKIEDDSGLLRRSKRSVKKKNISTCHSGKVYVDLSVYSNIIAPPGFYTHYCGNTYQLPVGNDPIIKNISRAIMNAYNSVKKFSAKVLSNPSCCVPKRHHDMYIFYVDQGFNTIRYIPNLKASRCVCKND